jgi:hypothetical protein
LFDRYFNPGHYPNIARVAKAGAFERPAGDATYLAAQARQAFEFGLPRVLDGIQAFIAARLAGP